MLPLALLIAATLGSILAGLATPTEASGVGALGALILAVVYRRLTFAGLKQAVISATHHLEHGAAARRDVEHLRRRVRAHGHRELDHRRDDLAAGAADRDARPSS